MITGIADLEAFTIIDEQHISDGDSGQAVDRPGHDAPVVYGIHMGEFVGEVAVGRYAKGRRLNVEDRLGEAPCNQTSPMLAVNIMAIQLLVEYSGGSPSGPRSTSPYRPKASQLAIARGAIPANK